MSVRHRAAAYGIAGWVLIALSACLFLAVRVRYVPMRRGMLPAATINLATAAEWNLALRLWPYYAGSAALMVAALWMLVQEARTE